jgi:hypothetical protein
MESYIETDCPRVMTSVLCNSLAVNINCHAECLVQSLIHHISDNDAHSFSTSCQMVTCNATGCSASHGGKADESAGRHASLTAAGHWSFCSASGMTSHHACRADATLTSVIAQLFHDYDNDKHGYFMTMTMMCPAAHLRPLMPCSCMAQLLSRMLTLC